MQGLYRSRWVRYPKKEMEGEMPEKQKQGNTGSTGTSETHTTGQGQNQQPSNQQSSQQQNNQDDSGQTQQQQIVPWEDFVKTLPQEHQTSYANHIQNLRSALQSERTTREDLSKQLKDAMSKVQAGSDLSKQLEEIQSQLELTQRRANFLQEAMTQNVINPNLAWLAAQDTEAFDKRGNPNWDVLRTKYPELFRQGGSQTRANAGSGTSQQQTGSGGMNTLIRRAAGLKE